jgi:hypothetical protein
LSAVVPFATRPGEVEFRRGLEALINGFTGA